MFCRNCGAQLPEGSSACTQCGFTPEAETASVEESVPTNDQPAESVAQAEPAEKVERVKKSLPKWVIPVGVAAAVLIATIVTIALLMFPLDVSARAPKNTTTKTGMIDKAVISIRSNQPISKVWYAVEPTSAKNLDWYTEGETSGGLFEKELTIQDLLVPPGTSRMFLRVQTWFGSETCTIKFTCDMGQVVTPDYESIVWLDENVRVVEEELLVGFKESVSDSEATALLESYGGEVIGKIYVLNHYQVRFTGSSLSDLERQIQQLKEEDKVAYVTYNYVVKNELQAIPNDVEYNDWNVSIPDGNNWHFECVDAPGAWEYQNQLRTTKVGVVDSTVFYGHEDLQIDPKRVIYLPTDDFLTIDETNEAMRNHSHAYDINGNCRMCSFLDHGTHVSGIIGAIANNEKGVCGINWNADLYFSNAWYYYDYSGGVVGDDLTVSNLIYSIAYLAMSDCRVINMSIGARGFGDAFVEEYGAAVEDMFLKLETAGYDFLVVKAAGNNDEDAVNGTFNRILTYGPTAKKHVIIVGAVEHAAQQGAAFESLPTQYSVAWYSDFGTLVDIVAPGSDIYSTISEGYESMSGTSMAAPMVTGVASMVYSANPSLTAEQVKEILVSKVTDYCAKEGHVYPLLNARLAVEHSLELQTAEPAAPVPQVGYVTGIVQDAVTGDILKQAAVMLKNNQTGEQVWANVLKNGTYYVYAEAGSYTLTFRAEGYLEETIYNVEVTTGVVTYNVLLNMVQSQAEAETGAVTGRVVDAFDASSIPNATIAVYRGINNKEGTPVTTITSDGSGNYTLELEPGNYTLRASAEGYTPSSTVVVIVGGATAHERDCTMTPILNEGELRVVLTWGQYPKDLDSHLVGPTPNNGRFHVFYHAKNSYYNNQKYVNLDVDDTTSYGPETTSVYQGVSGGTYTFFVHDFTNRKDSFSNEMATSGAVVKVYVGGVEEPYVFPVPSKEGTLWKVFSVKDGTLTPINEMSYIQDPRAIQ